VRSLFVSIILSGVICPAFAQIYTIRTLAGNEVEGYSGDGGPAAGAQLNVVNGVAVDAAGNVYIADTNNCRIRKVSKGVIATVAGNGNCGYSGDNGPATSAALYYPSAVAVDASGNLYIADTANNRIREVAGGVITTVAGNGYGACAPWPSCSGGFTGDNGSATSAELYSPNGVAVDSSGNIFISDTYNNRIREVSNGIITTIVGTGIGAYGGDGGLATNAKLYGPEAVAVDASGALYIADTGNNRVRKVQNGTITNVAGNGTQGYIGDGGNAINAEMYYPEGVAVDSAGNLFISDTGNNRIRKVTKLIISTIAGSGPSGGANGGYSGDNGVATNAELYAPVCIGVDATGNVYIADSDNFRVRELTPYTPVFSAQAASLGTATGSGSFQIAIADGIPWTAVSSVGWITITGGASGTGSGVVSFTVQANTGPARTGTITIGGQVFTITQESATATNLSLAGSIAQIASAGGWDTSLTLVNLGSASGEARLNFSGNDGSAPWLPFTFPGLVIASLLYSLPFAVQPFLSGFRSIDRRLLEASWCLGVSPAKTFRRVALPLAWPGSRQRPRFR